MAIPSVGGGYQDTDGNQNEITIGTQVAPQTATVTATLSVAQVTGGLLVATPGAATASYTLPTATLLDAQMTNMKVNSTFTLTIVNVTSATGVITIVAAANSGITLVGTATIGLSAAASTSPAGVAQFLFRKTDTAAYTVYRVS
jgi:hypothetical protein